LGAPDFWLFGVRKADSNSQTYSAEIPKVGNDRCRIFQSLEASQKDTGIF
jgi:hypothetical protein